MNIAIESVVAEAQERLERTGRLDITSFVTVYPEHAHELQELLPIMLHLHEEKRWQRAEVQSRAYALNLFPQVSTGAERTATAAVPTVADLFARERAEAGLTEAEQARRAGLPVQALRQLAMDSTPAETLDNTTIKQLATKVSAPFTALLKEMRRLLSLESLSGFGSGAVFTRDQQTSTDEEKRLLLEQVRRAAKKPPEGE